MRVVSRRRRDESMETLDGGSVVRRVAVSRGDAGRGIGVAPGTTRPPSGFGGMLLRNVSRGCAVRVGGYAGLVPGVDNPGVIIAPVVSVIRFEVNGEHGTVGSVPAVNTSGAGT